MQLALPELNRPATLILDRENGLSDDQYFAFCQANPDLTIERTSEGQIVIVPPAGAESDYRSVMVVGPLQTWAKANGKGKPFGSSAGFILPDGSALSPDAAWVSNVRLSGTSKRERTQFLRLVPEFVVEVVSPSDRLTALKKKMAVWIANGAELGWLIDGDAHIVYIYRPGSEPEARTGIATLAGEGPVEGFTVDLTSIWEGL